RLPEWGLAARDLARMAVAAIGPATAQALARYGVTPDLVPPKYVAEAVVAAVVARGPVHGKRFLVPRAREARDALPEGLRARGAVVDVIPVYETMQAAGDGSALAAQLVGGTIGPVHRRGDRSRDGRERPGAGSPRRDRGGGLYGRGLGGGAGALLRARGRGEGGRVSAVLKLGTRGSRLALWQAEWVQAALVRHGMHPELVVITTRGDAEVDRPLHELEGKGFFTKEIEDELLAGRIDVAV